jgi:hypothetical protein
MVLEKNVKDFFLICNEKHFHYIAMNTMYPLLFIACIRQTIQYKPDLSLSRICVAPKENNEGFGLSPTTGQLTGISSA